MWRFPIFRLSYFLTLIGSIALFIGQPKLFAWVFVGIILVIFYDYSGSANRFIWWHMLLTGIVLLLILWCLLLEINQFIPFLSWLNLIIQSVHQLHQGQQSQLPQDNWVYKEPPLINAFLVWGGFGQTLLLALILAGYRGFVSPLLLSYGLAVLVLVLRTSQWRLVHASVLEIRPEIVIAIYSVVAVLTLIFFPVSSSLVAAAIIGFNWLACHQEQLIKLWNAIEFPDYPL